MSPVEVLTIGVYGWTNDTFRTALQRAEVDGLVDIRARRGVRGAAHAFANRSRLEAMLGAAGIGYLHLLDLAPTQAIRSLQHQRDVGDGTLKRDRARLDPGFVSAYQGAILAPLDPALTLAPMRAFGRPCLLCVETHPDACHRSLAAQWIAEHLRVPVRHLLP